jgi:hypothetical protein
MLGVFATLGLVPTWAAAAAVGLTPLATACIASPFFTRKHAALQSWWLARTADWVGKKAIAAPAVLAAGAVYQGGVWDWVKALTGWTPQGLVAGMAHAISSLRTRGAT